MTNDIADANVSQTDDEDMSAADNLSAWCRDGGAEMMLPILQEKAVSLIPSDLYSAYVKRLRTAYAESGQERTDTEMRQEVGGVMLQVIGQHLFATQLAKFMTSQQQGLTTHNQDSMGRILPN